MREEKALQAVSELQDRLRDTIDAKRDIEMEFVALKKNYITLTSHVEQQKDKQKNLGVELINLRNENQQLNEDQNLISREKTNLSKEAKAYQLKIDKLESQNHKYRESTIEMKAEIERLKTKMIEYDLKDQ